MSAGAISTFFRRQLVTNALSLYTVQGLNYLTPLLVLPFLLRALGPAAFGTIVLAQALMGYAVILTSFGFNFTAARDISVARRDPEAVTKIYWTTMMAKGLLLLVSLVIVFAVVACTRAFRPDWAVYLACSLLVVGELLFPQWYFQGLEKLKEIALFQVIAKVATAGATIVLVKSPADLWLAAALSSAAPVAAVAIALCLGRSIAPASFYMPSVADVTAALKQSWHMFASSLSTTLYLNTNTFVLGLMCGTAAVADYGLATKVISALRAIAQPVTQAVFPRASLLFAERRNDAWQLLARVAKLVLPLIVLASLAVGLLAPQLVHILGGASYSGATSALRIMLIIPVVIVAAGIPAQIIMVNTGLTKQMLRIYVLVGVVNVLILPALVWAFAANGAALSLALAEVLACTLLAVTVWRHRKELR